MLLPHPSNKHLTEVNTQQLIDSFIAAQDVRHSSKTLYRRTLKQYFNWIERQGYPLSEIARPHIIEYKENLLTLGMSSLTVGSYVTVVRKFYEWAETQKIYPNVAKGIKTPKRKQQFRKEPLTAIQAIQLLDYFKSQSSRDYALINLLLRTGLRTIEVIRANVSDITFKGEQRVLLIQGKGQDEKDNFVILTDKAWQPIADYLNDRGRTNVHEPLFNSESNNSKGKRLSTRTISFIAKEGLKSIGLNSTVFSAHSLRHTAAVSILKAGGTLEMVQFTLRHNNPATTQIYTATLNDERRIANSGEALLDGQY